MRLLIIEDEEYMLAALERGLKKAGYSTDTAPDGITGLEMAELNGYDLILLDLNLPGMDGLDVLSEIRRGDELQRVLILSARGEYDDRIEGLDLGANDYLVKPFNFGELLARVRALLRRSFVQRNTEILFHGFSLDTKTRTLWYPPDQTVDLTPTEYAMLEYLLTKRGEPVDAAKLLYHARGNEESAFSNSTKVHISALRKKLAVFTDEPIISYTRGAGYMIAQEKGISR